MTTLTAARAALLAEIAAVEGDIEARSVEITNLEVKRDLAFERRKALLFARDLLPNEAATALPVVEAPREEAPRVRAQRVTITHVLDEIMAWFTEPHARHEAFQVAEIATAVLQKTAKVEAALGRAVADGKLVRQGSMFRLPADKPPVAERGDMPPIPANLRRPETPRAEANE